MHGDGGKGFGRRPSVVSQDEIAKQWDTIFGKKKHATVLAGNKDSQESEQRLHELEDTQGKPDVR